LSEIFAHHLTTNLQNALRLKIQFSQKQTILLYKTSTVIKDTVLIMKV